MPAKALFANMQFTSYKESIFSMSDSLVILVVTVFLGTVCLFGFLFWFGVVCLFVSHKKFCSVFIFLLTPISGNSDYLAERKKRIFYPTYMMRTALFKIKGMKITGVTYKFC